MIGENCDLMHLTVIRLTLFRTILRMRKYKDRYVQQQYCYSYLIDGEIKNLIENLDQHQ